MSSSMHALARCTRHGLSCCYCDLHLLRDAQHGQRCAVLRLSTHAAAALLVDEVIVATGQ